MAENRRAELIAAGVSLLSRQPFQNLLAAVETRAVADEVGVTTGSFFHHFRNRSHFAQAVVDAFVIAWTRRVDHLEAHASRFVDDNGASGLRLAASTEWDSLLADEDASRLQHLLWAVRDEVLSDETITTAGDVLQRCYEQLTERVEEPYRDGLRLIGRETLPPFTIHDLTVIMTAFEEGLQMRRGVDPGAVRDDLYADAVSAILLGVTRPRTERSAAVPGPELATMEARLSVQRHGEDADGVPVDVWRHIADSAADLFVDRSPIDVAITEVAAVAGVSTDAVVRQFGTVTAVAAAGWARHIPELEAIAREPMTEHEGPIRRIEQVMLRGVELARANRGAAEALICQVIAEAAPSPDRRWPRSIREEIPLPGLLVPLVRELRAGGHLRRRMDADRLSRSLVHLSTMQALVFTEESAARVVDETMTLVFDGALVVPSDA